MQTRARQRIALKNARLRFDSLQNRYQKIPSALSAVTFGSYRLLDRFMTS